MQGIFALILLLPMLGNSGIFLPFFLIHLVFLAYYESKPQLI